MMRKQSSIYILFALFCVLLLVGCQSEGKDGSEAVADETEEQTASEEVVEAYTVVDDTGEEVTFEEVPETVISLQPSNTEILFALGIGDTIVGATDFDNYPEEALEIERVSDSVEVNIEKAIELEPDVVFAYTIGDPAQIESLKEAGLKVFVIESATSFDDVYGDIEQIAEVMDVEEEGEQLITDIQSTLDQLTERVGVVEKPKATYLEISPSPDIYTTGSNTFQQEILDEAGVENVFADQEDWIAVSEEVVIEKNPELILTTVNYTDDSTGEIISRTGWDTIVAVQEEEVYEVDSDIMTRPGPRIAEAVEIIAELAYPDAFSN